jgi:hypothetical protein
VLVFFIFACNQCEERKPPRPFDGHQIHRIRS